MPELIEGNLTAKGFRFAIIVSRFNDFISSKNTLTDNNYHSFSRDDSDGIFNQVGVDLFSIHTKDIYCRQTTLATVITPVRKYST